VQYTYVSTCFPLPLFHALPTFLFFFQLVGETRLVHLTHRGQLGESEFCLSGPFYCSRKLDDLPTLVYDLMTVFGKGPFFLKADSHLYFFSPSPKLIRSGCSSFLPSSDLSCRISVCLGPTKDMAHFVRRYQIFPLVYLQVLCQRYLEHQLPDL